MLFGLGGKSPKDDHDLIFTNGKGNPESHSNLLQSEFYLALRRAKLRKIRFHGLRHTFCSLLSKNRKNPKRIQRWVIHRSGSPLIITAKCFLMRVEVWRPDSNIEIVVLVIQRTNV